MADTKDANIDLLNQIRLISQAIIQEPQVGHRKYSFLIVLDIKFTDRPSLIHYSSSLCPINKDTLHFIKNYQYRIIYFDGSL